VRTGGRVGLITSASFLVQPSFQKLRALLIKSTIERLAPLGPKAFADATVDTAIVVICRSVPSQNHGIVIQSPSAPSQLPTAPEYTVKQSRFAGNERLAFDYRLSSCGAEILNRLFRDLPSLESGYEFGVGINTGFIREELVSEKKTDARYHPMVAGDGISRYGPAEARSWIMYDREYIRSRGKLGRSLPAEHLLNSDKILVVRTRNLSLSRRIVSTLDESRAYNLNRLSNIVARSGYSLFGLLGFLNSQLFNWIFSTRFYDYEIKPVYLRTAPLANSNDPTLIGLVKHMLTLHQHKAAATTQAEQDLYQRQIEATDREIDALVYELYELTADEIAVVEGRG
jgi:adenine-specific DNA-methyltransferase